MRRRTWKRRGNEAVIKRINPILRGWLTAIGLRGVAETLEDLLARATASRMSPTTLIEEIVRIEAAERARRGLERRLSDARVGRFKPMADFDWSWPKKIDRDLIEQALALGFITEHRNVALVASNGLGKTMLALEYPGVDAFHHGNPGVIAQSPIELPLAHVEGNNVAGATFEQYIGESAGRGADIQASRSDR